MNKKIGGHSKGPQSPSQAGWDYDCCMLQILQLRKDRIGNVEKIPKFSVTGYKLSDLCREKLSHNKEQVMDKFSN